MSKVDQSPEKFREFFEEKGWFVDGDMVIEFMNHVVREPFTPPSEKCTRSVAVLLFEMVQAAKYGRDWNQYKKRLDLRKVTSTRFDPGSVTITDDAFGIVAHYLDGQCTEQDMVDLFKEHVAHADDRQVRRWIADLRPRVEKFLAWRDELHNSADK